MCLCDHEGKGGSGNIPVVQVSLQLRVLKGHVTSLVSVNRDSVIVLRRFSDGDVHYLSYFFLNPCNALLRILFDGLSPEPDHGPSPGGKIGVVLPVPLHVAGYFGNPEIRVVPFGKCFLQGVPVLSMKEFTVTEYRDAVLREGNVGFAWKILFVLAVSYAPCPEGMAEEDLYGCVLCPYLML